MVDAARRAALVDDVRLARVLDVGEAKGITYIVTEHLNGRALEEYVRTASLPSETVRRIVGESAQALDRAGQRGLHHLVLSPDNVWILPDGAVKISGMAIEAAARGLESNDADKAQRHDVQDLVRVVYAGLTGRWPGSAETTTTSLEPAPEINGRPVSPSELAPSIPADLNTLCQNTLNLLGRGEQGPRTPAELASQLSPWVRASPLPAPAALDMQLPPTERVGTDAAGIPVTMPPPPSRPSNPSDATRPNPVVSRPNGSPATRQTPPEEPASTARVPVPDTSVVRIPAPDTSVVPITDRPAKPIPSPASPPTAPAGSKSSASAPPSPPAPTPRGGAEPSISEEILLNPTASAPGVRHLDAAPRPTLNRPGPPVVGGWSGPDDDRVGPFLPQVPLSSPPREQTRLVMGLMIGLVIFGLIASMFVLRGLFTRGDQDATTTDRTRTPGATSAASSAANPAASSGTPNASTSATAGTPLKIKSVVSVDPQGDGSENPRAAPWAIDGDPATEWRSERYDTAAYGGLPKQGVGLVLNFGKEQAISQVVIDQTGSGGVLELRAATQPSYEGSQLIQSVPMGSTKTLTVQMTEPVTTQYLLLWFTKVPKQSNGEYRLRVIEVSVG